MHLFTVFYLIQPSSKQIICFDFGKQNSVLPIVFYVSWFTGCCCQAWVFIKYENNFIRYEMAKLLSKTRWNKDFSIGVHKRWNICSVSFTDEHPYLETRDEVLPRMADPTNEDLRFFFLYEQSLGILKTQRLWKFKPQNSHFKPWKEMDINDVTCKAVMAI